MFILGPIMPEKTTDIQTWITRIQKSSNSKEVFQTLEEFRPGPWSDEDRAKMAKAYIRVLERVGVTTSAQAEEEESKDDGPVWYEKM